MASFEQLFLSANEKPLGQISPRSDAEFKGLDGAQSDDATQLLIQCGKN